MSHECPKKPDDDSRKNLKMTRSALLLNRDTAVPKSAAALASAKTMSTDGSGNYRDQHEGASTDGLTREQLEAELKRLRKENKRLEMEREILKKAAAFFANESK